MNLEDEFNKIKTNFIDLANKYNFKYKVTDDSWNSIDVWYSDIQVLYLRISSDNVIRLSLGGLNRTCNFNGILNIDYDKWFKAVIRITKYAETKYESFSYKDAKLLLNLFEIWKIKQEFNK